MGYYIFFNEDSPNTAIPNFPWLAYCPFTLNEGKLFQLV